MIDHGKRAVILLDELVEAEIVHVTNLQYRQLAEALASHNKDFISSGDITIQTCWDADRLDLWRIGIEPNPEMLFTGQAKDKKMIEFAGQLYKKFQKNN